MIQPVPATAGDPARKADPSGEIREDAVHQAPGEAPRSLAPGGRKHSRHPAGNRLAGFLAGAARR